MSINSLFQVLANPFDSIVISGFSIGTCLIILGVALLLGVLTSLTYIFVKRKVGYGSDFPITLIILPVIVSMVIYFVRDNIAGGLSLAGIFALTRFRSEQKDTEDIAYIFLSVGIGLSCGLGYVLGGVIIAAIMMLVLIVLYLTGFGIPGVQNMTLKIVVPEDINYDNLFDDILDKYCQNYQLTRVRTTDFGTMFELTFRLTIKKGINQKELIDQIRTRNGNLNVTLVVRRYQSGDVR